MNETRIREIKRSMKRAVFVDDRELMSSNATVLDVLAPEWREQYPAWARIEEVGKEQYLNEDRAVGA